MGSDWVISHTDVFDGDRSIDVWTEVAVMINVVVDNIFYHL